MIIDATFSPLAPPIKRSHRLGKAVIFGVIAVGIISCVARLGKERDGWFADQPERLPPRKVESAAQRNRVPPTHSALTRASPRRGIGGG